MDYTLILTILLYVVLIANVAAAIAILFFERRDVSATWAWLMILFFLARHRLFDLLTVRPFLKAGLLLSHPGRPPDFTRTTTDASNQ